MNDQSADRIEDLFPSALIALGTLAGTLAWYAITLRRVVPGVLLIVLAAQTFFGSFMNSLASLERK